MKNLPDRLMTIMIAALIGACLLLPTAGCGGQKAEQQKSSGSGQSKAQGQGQEQKSSKPIDSALKDQMNMYKDIKQYEFEEAEKLRKADKTQLKKLRENQSDSSSKSDGSAKGENEQDSSKAEEK